MSDKHEFTKRINFLIEGHIKLYEPIIKGSINELNEELKLLINNLSNEELKNYFIAEINNIKCYDILDRFIQCIANCNYRQHLIIKKNNMKE